MARYTGPKSKIARKFGEPIYGPDKALERRNYPSGQHGLARRRRKISEYGVQLKEKQKAKYTYGLLEKQFRILFEKAERAGGVTGEVLLQMLECRLDNVVYRLGIAPTRAAARQLVSHLEVVADSLRSNRVSKYSWLEWDGASMSGKLLNVPERSDIPENIKEQLIVELYSK